MGAERERYEAWLKTWRGVRTAEEEAEVLAVADAYDAAMERHDLSSERLKVIVDAASSRRSLLWQNATGMLARLAVRWRIAADAVRYMFQDRQSHVRFAALCCVTLQMPSEIIEDLLRRGLTDKSSRVRWKAAQRIGEFNKTDLLPELEATFASETNAKARPEIELELLLLRDGYIVSPSTPSRFEVCVRTSHGIRGRFVSAAEMNQKGLATIVAELRDT